MSSTLSHSSIKPASSFGLDLETAALASRLRLRSIADHEVFERKLHTPFRTSTAQLFIKSPCKLSSLDFQADKPPSVLRT